MGTFDVPYTPSFDTTSEMFRTHWNYIKCLNKLFTNLKINVNVRTTNYIDPSPTKKFEKLSQITNLSIQSELKACSQEVAYASVIAPWIPVKCYYRLYYLESNFLYFLCSESVGFRTGGHGRVRSSLLDKLESGKINFVSRSTAELSDINTWESANIFSTSSGSNISGDYHMYPDCHKSIKKKIAEYIKIDWMDKNNIKDFRTLKARRLRNDDLKSKKFILTDYFYWMRIKANYRDVDFLDFEHDVGEEDSYEYIKEFIETTEKYASALQEAIAAIKVQRGIS